MSNERFGVDCVNYDCKNRMDENRVRFEVCINEMKFKFNMEYVDFFYVEVLEGWIYRWLCFGFRDGMFD